jgi:hypothetical protein
MCNWQLLPLWRVCFNSVLCCKVFLHHDSPAPRSTCQTQAVGGQWTVKSGPSILLFGPLKQHLSGFQFCIFKWKWLLVIGCEYKPDSWLNRFFKTCSYPIVPTHRVVLSRALWRRENFSPASKGIADCKSNRLVTILCGSGSIVNRVFRKSPFLYMA